MIDRLLANLHYYNKQEETSNGHQGLLCQNDSHPKMMVTTSYEMQKQENERKQVG